MAMSAGEETTTRLEVLEEEEEVEGLRMRRVGVWVENYK